MKAVEDNSHRQSKFNEIEEVFNQLKAENSEQKSTIDQLKTDFERVQNICLEFDEKQCELERKVEELTAECTALKSDIHSLKTESSETSQKSVETPRASGFVSVSKEQQELNSNIIIRGVEPSTDGKIEPNLVYDSICDHLGIADDEAFTPISVDFIQTSTVNRPTTNKIIKVQLRSNSAKKQFLQIRRRKKEITLADIGLCQESKKSILITEQLTRSNQELLFAARSLRDTHKFKFVWSSDGQILVRSQPKAKVSRILDIGQVNELRSQINLPPIALSKHGRSGARINIESNESCSSS